MKHRLLLIAIAFFMAIPSTFADINLRVSPIIYKITVDPGDVVTRTVTIENVDAKTYNITTAKSDFHA